MLARALVLREPCVVGDLALTQKQILEFYSEYKNYCPVSFKSKVFIKIYRILLISYN